MIDFTKEYSEKELALVRELGFENLIYHMTPPVLYRYMAESVFLNDRHSLAVDSLRRCLNAVNKSHPYRLTPEFDELIRIEKG